MNNDFLQAAASHPAAIEAVCQNGRVVNGHVVHKVHGGPHALSIALTQNRHDQAVGCA